MSNRDKANLLAMLDAVEQIERYTVSVSTADQFYDERLVFDATLMNFVVVGEMCSRLSQPLVEKYSKIKWRKIKGFRNLIAHDYLGIDAEEVWQIIQTDLLPLKQELKEILLQL